MGFQLESPEEGYLWRMYQCYKNGISPKEFKKNQNKDIIAMIQIDNMMNEKQRIEMEMASLRGRK